MAAERIVFATSTCKLVDRAGMGWQLIQNTPWNGDDPLVRQRPDHFQDRPLFLWHTVDNPREQPATQPTTEPKRYLRRKPEEAKVPAAAW
jgi:hypothetical protein